MGIAEKKRVILALRNSLRKFLLAHRTHLDLIPSMRPPHQPNHLPISGQRAFSLIEVTLALGVVSFALVSLMGLLPIGLISVREAMSQTACTHIVQRMSADMEMMTPGDLNDYVNKPKYFDYNGGYLENGSQSSATFVANLSTNDLEYPGSSRLSS